MPSATGGGFYVSADPWRSRGALVPDNWRELDWRTMSGPTSEVARLQGVSVDDYIAWLIQRGAITAGAQAATRAAWYEKLPTSEFVARLGKWYRVLLVVGVLLVAGLLWRHRRHLMFWRS